MDKYWYKAGADAHWNTLDNWWDDRESLGEGHSDTQAESVPQGWPAMDFVHLLGPIAPDTGPGDINNPIYFIGFDTSGLTCRNLSIDVTQYIKIAPNGMLVMGEPAGPGNHHVWAGTALGGGNCIATFNDAANNFGAVDAVTFNDTAQNGGGTVGTAHIRSTADQNGTWGSDVYCEAQFAFANGNQDFNSAGSGATTLHVADASLLPTITAGGYAVTGSAKFKSDVPNGVLEV